MNAAEDKLHWEVVFEGKLVNGFVYEDVRKAFSERYGEKVACSVFSKSRVVLKRKLSREHAERVQGTLAAIGMTVTLDESIPAGYSMTIIEEEDPGDLPGQASVARTTGPAAENDSDAGVIAGRAAVSTDEPRNEIYGLREIEAAFDGRVELPAASRSYLSRLIPVAGLMLLLPVLYVALAGLSLYGIWALLTDVRSWWFDLVRPGYFSVIVYGAALMAAVFLSAFMFKPLLAKSDSGPEPVRLDPNREPTLFALVDEITDAVGAPMPDEILVDTAVNASARLSRGPFSRELTLTIGLPLIWGSDVRTVTAILAHEFGHFTQAWGMRASYAVHWTNYWFHRQVHEPDSWDDAVDRLFEQDHVVFTLAGTLARAGSFLCRQLLLGLSYVASVLSYSFSRQMEFDADRYEIALLGSAEYQRTAERLRVLSTAYQLVLQDLDMALDANKKVDNLPKLVVNRAERFTDQEVADIVRSIDDVNTSVFDTHPTDQERIARAEAADAEPRFHFDGPATGLVRELHRLSKTATLQWYRSFGISTHPDELIPISEFDSESEGLAIAGRANQAYFGPLSDLPVYLAMPPQQMVAKVSTEKLVAGLEVLRPKIAAVESSAAGKRDELYGMQALYPHYWHARFYAKAGFEINRNDYEVPLRSIDADQITTILNDHSARQETLVDELGAVAELVGKRLAVGLELARRIELVTARELVVLRDAYDKLRQTRRDASELRESFDRLSVLAVFCEGFPDRTEHRRDTEAEKRLNEAAQSRIYRCLSQTRDPFRPELSLDHCLPDVHATGQASAMETLHVAGSILRQLGRLSFRVRGRMAELALSAEGQYADTGR